MATDAELGAAHTNELRADERIGQRVDERQHEPPGQRHHERQGEHQGERQKHQDEHQDERPGNGRDHQRTGPADNTRSRDGEWSHLGMAIGALLRRLGVGRRPNEQPATEETPVDGSSDAPTGQIVEQPAKLSAEQPAEQPAEQSAEQANEDASKQGSQQQPTETTSNSDDLQSVQKPSDDTSAERPAPLPDAVSFSSQICAAARAFESSLPEEVRLFYDPLAEKLAGPVAMQSARDRRASSTGPSDSHPDQAPTEKRLSPRIPIRTRFFDDFLADALTPPAAIPSDQGDGERAGGSPQASTSVTPKQIVILGAGMDTRPFRVEALARHPDIVLYEVDQEPVVALKTAILDGIDPPPKPHCRVVRVVADLSELGWESHLVLQGFDWQAPTVWILEGLVYYFDAEQVEALFRTVASLSAVGSPLAVSAVRDISPRNKSGAQNDSHEKTEPINSKLRTEKDAKNVKLKFRWACPDPEAFFEKVGFQIDRIATLGSEHANYGIWPADKEPSHNTMYITMRPAFA